MSNDNCSMNDKYVLGFMVWEDEVLLVRKLKPDWQRGKLNGIGGKIEGTECPLEAMVREFKEETGIETVASDWNRLCYLFRQNGAQINVFFAKKDFTGFAKINASGEANYRCRLRDIPHCYESFIIPNVKWMLEMTQDPGITKMNIRMEYV